MTSTLAPGDRQDQKAPPEQLRPRRALWREGPIIRMQDAGKSFGKDKVVVHDLNFEVTPGEIFCLLGPSGSGKSTTMRMLTGLYKPSQGKVLVFGREPHAFRKKWRERIGYMPQQFVLFPEISTLGNVNFVASVYGMSWFRRAPKIKRALEFVDLWDARNKLASQLSGGMQRRLELAATLVHNPELIFVDEPTAGIDPILRQKFWDHFRELRDQGRTIFVTTQYVTEADYCDKVAILNRGRVLALGAPGQIRRDAFGGDIINLSLEFVSPQSIEIIRRVPGVTYVQFLNTQDLKLTVTDGAEIIPVLISALQEANIPVKTIEQYRPDFEEVFVQLMEHDQAEDEDEEMVAPTRAKKEKKPEQAAPAPVQPQAPKPPVQVVPRPAPPPPAPPVVIKPAAVVDNNGRPYPSVQPQAPAQPVQAARTTQSPPVLQPRSRAAGGESPVPPGGPDEPYPPIPGPLPGPDLPGGPDNPPVPGQPGLPGQSARSGLSQDTLPIPAQAAPNRPPVAGPTSNKAVNNPVSAPDGAGSRTTGDNRSQATANPPVEPGAVAHSSKQEAGQ